MGVVVVAFVVVCLLDKYTWSACAMNAYVQNANVIYIYIHKANICKGKQRVVCGCWTYGL